MHLQGIPVAVIAAWIGYKDASLTPKLYTHSQTDWPTVAIQFGSSCDTLALVRTI